MPSAGKSKLAWVKVLVPVGVALLSFIGVVLGVWAQVRTGNTGAALRATVEQLNKSTIPRLEELLREQRGETRKHIATLAWVRERLAGVEARLRIKPKRTGSGGNIPVLMGPPIEIEKLFKKAVKKPVALIPRLNVRQLAQLE